MRDNSPYQEPSQDAPRKPSNFDYKPWCDGCGSTRDIRIVSDVYSDDVVVCGACYRRYFEGTSNV